MKIKHPAVKSSFFQLVQTYELDLDLAPELSFPLRIEILRDTGHRGLFRVRVLELEFFNLEPTFRSKRNGKRLRYKSTELIWLERASDLSGKYDSFKASSAAAALGKVVADLKQRLEHWTGVKPK